jgi:nitrite reductase (NO-forming)
VTGLDFRFQPAEIRIKAGQNVNIALANRGAIIHDITIPALQVSLVAQPGQRVTAGLAAARPGTYEFYCSVPGHREAGMVGRLVVVP